MKQSAAAKRRTWEAWRLELENALRLAKGEPPLQSLDDLETDDDLAAVEEDLPPPKIPCWRKPDKCCWTLIGFGRKWRCWTPAPWETWRLGASLTQSPRTLRTRRPTENHIFPATDGDSGRYT